MIDSIRLIPLCILLLSHLVCPEKSFFANTTLGVSHYETSHSCLRRRPRPHRSRCFHPDLLRLHQEQSDRCQGQHASRSHVRSGRSQCLWHGPRPLSPFSWLVSLTLCFSILFTLENPKRGHIHENHRPCIRRNPRPYRCSRNHTDLVRFHPEQGNRRQGEYASRSHVRTG